MLRLAVLFVALVLLAGAVSSPGLSHLGNARQSSSGVAVSGIGTPRGFEIYVARSSNRWQWQALATLQPAGLSNDTWTGYACLTGDTKHVIAVVAPRSFANVPVLRDRGGTAYDVDVATGRVRPLVSSVSLKYHTPSCGRGSNAVITRSLGRDQARTEVFVVDATHARVIKDVSVPGQVTSVVPVGTRVIGAAGNAVVQLRKNRAELLAKTPGQPYMLRPSSRDGVDLLVATGRQQASALHLARDFRTLRTVARGNLQVMRLFGGAGGKNVLVGGRASEKSGLLLLHPPKRGVASTVASDGSAIVYDPSGHASVPAPGTAISAPSQPIIETAAGEQLSRSFPAPAASTRAMPTSSRHAVRKRKMASAQANYTTPKCDVPRNATNRQAIQPNAAMVDWAIQQATRNLLQGSVLTRPAGYLNMGLVSYQPSSDFGRGALHGWPSSPVPRSVIEGVFAQESNFMQASFHALPGVAGNPLIADYYGAAGTLDVIDYDNADCGYGVSQVTDPMTTASTTYSEHGKWKVALDYAENVAAGIQFLVDKWNQTYDAGVIANNGDPQDLENWYFAIWAYNTGFHANTGSGPWGLGWTNNPRNADYCPCREPFLRTTYADAAHPADWPYQERVIGFMETPLIDYQGNPSYPTPSGSSTQYLTLPDNNAFCTASDDCDPNYVDSSDPSLSYCTRADRMCWWHQPVNWVTDCASTCVKSVFTVPTTATEPANDNNYPPVCNSSLPTGTVIVDDEPTDVNVRGCSSTNWSSSGTFSVDYGTQPPDVPLGQIDWHQLGVGFGGHVWFTHPVAAYDDPHVDTATWTPPSSMSSGTYAIRAHIPDNGATYGIAPYLIYPGDGSVVVRTIDQHLNQNKWVWLGNFNLQTGAKVVLSNRLRWDWLHSGDPYTDEQPGATDIAFDAVAFTPVSHSDNALAARFRPILRFSSQEDWRPLNVESFLSEYFDGSDGQPGHYHQLCEDKGAPTNCVDITSWHTLQQHGEGWDFSDQSMWPVIVEHGEGDTISNYQSPTFGPACNPNGLDIHDCDIDATRTSIYWHRVGPFADSDYVYFDYWYFYRFNKSEGDDHQADWEGTTVAVPADATDPSTFAFAAFSAHGSQWHYLRDTLQCDNNLSSGSCGNVDSPSGQRVVDYVADGSHANYPFGCHNPLPIAYGCEQTTSDGGTFIPPEKDYDGQWPWGANDDPAALIPFGDTPGWGPGVPVANRSWIDWPGWWGDINSDSHVVSPATLRGTDVYHRPDQAISCTTRNSSSTCGSEPPAAEGMSRLGPTAPSRGDAACGTWAGPGVAVAVCDSRELQSALRQGTVGTPGSFSVGGHAIDGRAVARGSGILQVVGPPISAGSRLAIGGVTRTSTVTVRAKSGAREVTARFSGSELVGHRYADVRFLSADNPTSIVLVDDSGAHHRPLHLAVLRLKR